MRYDVKRKTAVLCILCVCSAITLLIGIRSEKNTTRKTTVSSLLNSRYLPSVAEITLSQVGKSPVILQKRPIIGETESRWYVRTASSYGWYLAKPAIVEQFLSALSATGTFYQVADRYRDWQSFGVTESDGINVMVSVSDGNGNEEVCSSLHFGFVSATGTHIAVRSNTKETVYQVADVYSRYFTDDELFWADRTLFPDSSGSLDWIQSFSVESGGYTRLLFSGEQRFENLSDSLHTFSGGQFVSPSDFSEQKDAMEFVLGIYAVGSAATSRFYDISLFKTKEGTYIAECQSPFGCNCMTVSSWTVGRLMESVSY